MTDASTQPFWRRHLLTAVKLFVGGAILWFIASQLHLDDRVVLSGGDGVESALVLPVAQHLLAVCYYAMNYGEDRAFSPWLHYTASDGYCRSFRIPTKDEVLRNKGGS